MDHHSTTTTTAAAAAATTTAKTCHVIAMPYPGRGHINPMLSFCKLIAIRNPNILITFIVTEQWLGFLTSGSEPPTPHNIRYATIPNVVPSEIGRGKDFAGFFRAALTKLEAPVEQLLDRLDEPSVIVYDTYMSWVVRVGNRRNIPVASFYTMSATIFSIFHHIDLLAQKGHLNFNVSERGREQVDYIPGVSSISISDLPTPLYGNGKEVLNETLEAFSEASKAKYLLLTSVYELEAPVIDVLKHKLSTPIYTIGPAIPYFTSEVRVSQTNTDNEPDYIKWLNAQPSGSVLYISQGSFLSASSAQLDEIVAGVHESGVRFFWVARDETGRFQKDGCSDGLVVPWCEQLKVLSHPAIGGFWSHCGWNSTKEALFAGLTVLTFPIFWDQQTNSKLLVEDWKIGRRVKSIDGQDFVTSDDISSLLKRFMDCQSDEVIEMRKRAKEFQKICQRATTNGGSSEINIDAFIKDVLSHKYH